MFDILPEIVIRSKCGRVKPRSNIPHSFLIWYQKLKLPNSKLRIHSKPDRNQSKLTVCILETLCASYFLKMKLFFVKTENWKFQHLFDIEFCETSQKFQMSSECWLNGQKICEVSQHPKSTRRDDENFNFLSWQVNKFYS